MRVYQGGCRCDPPRAACPRHYEAAPRLTFPFRGRGACHRPVTIFPCSAPRGPREALLPHGQQDAPFTRIWGGASCRLIMLSAFSCSDVVSACVDRQRWKMMMEPHTEPLDFDSEEEHVIIKGGPVVAVTLTLIAAETFHCLLHHATRAADSKRWRLSRNPHCRR